MRLENDPRAVWRVKIQRDLLAYGLSHFANSGFIFDSGQTLMVLIQIFMLEWLFRLKLTQWCFSQPSVTFPKHLWKQLQRRKHLVCFIVSGVLVNGWLQNRKGMAEERCSPHGKEREQEESQTETKGRRRRYTQQRDIQWPTPLSRGHLLTAHWAVNSSKGSDFDDINIHTVFYPCSPPNNCTLEDMIL